MKTYTPEKFEAHLDRLSAEFKEAFHTHAHDVIGKVAVDFFKQNFQNEAWGRDEWQEVKRRIAGEKLNKYYVKKGSERANHKILTESGALGRSIEVNESKTGNGEVAIWTNPDSFGSIEPYGRVHNEGGQAGRGSGFTMPKRQFMGEHPELNFLIIKALQKKLKQITKQEKNKS